MKKYLLVSTAFVLLLAGCGKDESADNMDKAITAYNEKKYDQAILLFENVVKEDPSNKNAENFIKAAVVAKALQVIAKGDEAYGLKKYKKALAYYEKALPNLPKGAKGMKEIEDKYSDIKAKAKEQAELDSYKEWATGILQRNNELGNKWDNLKTEFALNRVSREEFAASAGDLLPLAKSNYEDVETKGYSISKGLGESHAVLASLATESRGALINVITASNANDEYDEQMVKEKINAEGTPLDELKMGQSTFIQTLRSYASGNNLEFDSGDLN